MTCDRKRGLARPQRPSSTLLGVTVPGYEERLVEIEAEAAVLD
jgi:hypothetical protein